MMLRSSSTPVLGSLVSSISESPNHHHYQPEIAHQPTNKHPPTTVPHSLNKVSFHQGGLQNFSFSCNSSPISPSVSEFSIGSRCLSSGLRRAQSEGSLEGLGNASSSIDEFSLSNPKMKFQHRSGGCFLETIPSFSFRDSTIRFEDEGSEHDEDEEEEEAEEETTDLENKMINYSIRGNMEKLNYEFNGKMSGISPYAYMGYQKEIDENQQMHLARGPGSVGLDFNFSSGNGYNGGNHDRRGSSGSGDGGENNLGEHYKKMVQENPGNSLFLRNYAQFLYQTKQDLKGAEEYYSRAILIDPKDGEVLSQYAKLIWELHHDQDRATGYFQRAVQVAPEDSYIHAAYASFLWDTEDEEDAASNDSRVLTPLLYRGVMASASA